MKRLNKKALAELIEQVLWVNHKAVRFVRKPGGWLVTGTGSRFLKYLNPPTVQTINVRLEGWTLLEAAKTDPMLASAIRKHEATIAKGKERHVQDIAERKAA